MMYRFISWLADTKVLKTYPQFAKIFLMVYPLFVITFFNHWLAALVGFGFYIFLSSIVIKWIEDGTGLSIYAKKIFDPANLRKIDAIKIVILCAISVPCVAFFASVNPLKFIYISGFA
ncbi:MAG: hypothetical protein JJW01_02935 [Alphaproteobacteria bacterium]|nr:hypothetical protein [Rickettsiales bacterium]